MGRKASEINFPFEAKKKDLPALASSAEKEDLEGASGGGGGGGGSTGGDEQPPPFDWKRHLSKCIRLTRKTAVKLGEEISDQLLDN